jgi:hypothetical protein
MIAVEGRNVNASNKIRQNIVPLFIFCLHTGWGRNRIIIPHIRKLIVPFLRPPLSMDDLYVCRPMHETVLSSPSKLLLKIQASYNGHINFLE